MRKVFLAFVLILSFRLFAGVGMVEAPNNPHFGVGRWPKGTTTIKYFVDAEIRKLPKPSQKPSLASEIKNGVDAWKAARPPITFEESEKPLPGAYVHFKVFGQSDCPAKDYPFAGKSNKIGYKGNVAHVVCLQEGATQHTVEHELGHVLGLVHEQVHCDAPLHIRQIKKNERFLKCAEENIENATRVDDSGNAMMITPYNFLSVMHYTLPDDGHLTALGAIELLNQHVDWMAIGRQDVGAGDVAALKSMYSP
jgi:hypothetical protein